MDRVPSSSAAPIHHPEPPLYEKEELEAPVRILLFGVPLTYVLLVLALLGGSIFGIAKCVTFSQSEVERAGDEIHRSPRNSR